MKSSCGLLDGNYVISCVTWWWQQNIPMSFSFSLFSLSVALADPSNDALAKASFMVDKRAAMGRKKMNY